jgi:hypothetical protein
MEHVIYLEHPKHQNTDDQRNHPVSMSAEQLHFLLFLQMRQLCMPGENAAKLQLEEIN